jgi:paraquat-inducible protein B
MGAVFAMFAGWYFWIPKMLGLTYNMRLSKIKFWILLFGVNINSQTIYLILKILNIILLLIFSIYNVMVEDFVYMNSDPNSLGNNINSNNNTGEFPGNQPPSDNTVTASPPQNEDDKIKADRLKTRVMESYDHLVKQPNNSFNNRLNKARSQAGVKDIIIEKHKLTEKEVLVNLKETKQNYLIQKKLKEKIVKRIQKRKEPFYPNNAKDSFSGDVKLIDLLVNNLNTQIKNIKSHDSLKNKIFKTVKNIFKKK